MKPISFARHRSPAPIIPHAVWLNLRFTLSVWDIEDLLAWRGIDASFETVRRWVLKFGPAIARNLRGVQPNPSSRWHLDEMVVTMGGNKLKSVAGNSVLVRVRPGAPIKSET